MCTYIFMRFENDSAKHSETCRDLPCFVFANIRRSVVTATSVVGEWGVKDKMFARYDNICVGCRGTSSMGLVMSDAYDRWNHTGQQTYHKNKHNHRNNKYSLKICLVSLLYSLGTYFF